MDMFDEFGNAIAPADDDDDGDDDNVGRPSWMVEDADDDVDDKSNVKGETAAAAGAPMTTTTAPTKNDLQIILHEDKVYYPDASEVYPTAEVLVEDEDRQGIDVPIIDPAAKKSFTHQEAESFEAATFSKEFLCELQKCPEFVRNIAVVGHLHHGKTTFMDMLVQQTHEKKWSVAKNVSAAAAASLLAGVVVAACCGRRRCGLFRARWRRCPRASVGSPHPPPPLAVRERAQR